MNTDFFKKEGMVATQVTKHGNKAYNGLSAAAIVWMFATFATKSDVALVSTRCDKCEEARTTYWMRLMDHEVALAKQGITVVSWEPKDRP